MAFRVTARVEAFDSLEPGRIKQVLLTEYEPGAGIGWHRDKPHFDRVYGLSLKSPCRFRFRRKSGNRWNRFMLQAQPRSLYRDGRTVTPAVGAQHSSGRGTSLFRNVPDDERINVKILSAAPRCEALLAR